jgi:hypothetical protein
MSYDITSWTTLKIKNLSFNMEDFSYPPNRIKNGWSIQRSLDFKESGEHSLEIDISTERGSISGGFDFESNRITAEKCEIAGIGSGVAWFDCLLPALKKSRGYLEAIVIWESGDSVGLLTVKDGQVTESDIV